MVGVRRPVYLQDVDRGRPPSDRGQTATPTKKVSVPTVRPTSLPMPSAGSLENRLRQAREQATQQAYAGVPPSQRNAVSVTPQLGGLGAPLQPSRQFSPVEDVAWKNTLLDLAKTTDYYDMQRANQQTGGGGGGGPSRQQLIDEAFAGLPSRDVYTGESDFAALADYYARGRQQLEDVYGGATGRIGATTAETLAALQALDPQAAFVYDVGAPNIPGVNVDYLRALGASADPVSAEAEFARNLLGYQLAASQQAAAGMTSSLERERQARQAASQLMQQEGLRQAAAARAQALAQIAAQQAAEEAIVRERVRAAQQAEADRQQELDMLRLELQLAGID